MIYPTFVDHLVFRVTNLDSTGRLYTALLGPPHQAENSLMYIVGDTRLFFTISDQRHASAYDKEKVGLNHIAFGVRTAEELRAIRSQLDRAGITNSGIMQDHYGLKDFLWLDDPDGIRLEFYLRPNV